MKKFRSFLNDDNAAKRFAVITVCFIAVAFVAWGIYTVCTHSNGRTAENSTTASTEAFTDNSEVSFEKYNLPSEYRSFECEGDYFSFEPTNVRNQDGILFSSVDTDEELNIYHCDSIVYHINDEEKTLYSIDDPNVHIFIYCFIDDALYFSVSNLNDVALYRAVPEYGDNGEISIRELSLVFSDEVAPVKAEKNTLIISMLNGQYYSLDTITGVSTPIDYNSEIDTANMPDEVKIDFRQAQSIALSKLCNAEYFYGYDHKSEDFVLEEHSLIYRPDYAYTSEWIYEQFPEYAWEINYITDYRCTVYVNAETGNVSSVRVEFLD